MVSFKAANPGCEMEDFIRWHSPRDWVTRESAAHSGEERTMSTDGDGNLIDMAFSKKRVEDRKAWLNSYEPGTYLDMTGDDVRYDDFINKELILFSRADLMRSIPSVVDGFKPSQRKVLFSCFKRKLKSDIKVAQLSGYVSEHSAYHPARPASRPPSSASRKILSGATT